MAAAHELCAARLLALCLANGGVYVKLGQHVGQESSALPAGGPTAFPPHRYPPLPVLA